MVGSAEAAMTGRGAVRGGKLEPSGEPGWYAHFPENTSFTA